MTDDNVHLIVDQARDLPSSPTPTHPLTSLSDRRPRARLTSRLGQVRKVLAFHSIPRQAQSGFSMGTLVTMVDNRMFRRLWDRDFTVLAMGTDWEAQHHPAWVHDCWLDCLAAGLVVKQAASSFVLDPSYATARSLALLSNSTQPILRKHPLLTELPGGNCHLPQVCGIARPHAEKDQEGARPVAVPPA